MTTNDTLLRLFQASFNADPAVRKRAEDELQASNEKDGFMLACFHLIVGDNVDMAARQAATIYFKNLVKKYWSSRKPDEQNEIKRLIIPALGMAAQTIRAQLVHALGFVLADAELHDGSPWPQFSQVVLECLHSGQPVPTLSGVLALQEYMKIQQWKIGDKKTNTAFELFIHEAFPKLLTYGQAFVTQHFQQADQSTLLLMKSILKVFRSAIQSAIPQELQDFRTLGLWIEFSIVSVKISTQILSHSHDNLQQPIIDGWVRIQKWSYYCLNHLFSRFGCVQSDAFRNGYKKFAKTFMDTFAAKMVAFALEQVEVFVNGYRMQDKTLHVLVSFLTDCVRSKHTWTHMCPFINLVLEKFIFPLLCMTDDDEECWNDDPVEYITRRSNPIENFYNPSSAASNFLLTLYSSQKKEASMIIFDILAQKLQNPNSVREQDGSLNALAVMAEKMVENKKVSASIPQIFQNFVFTQLHSTVPVLKARACQVVQLFAANYAEDDCTLPWAEMFMEVLKFIGNQEALPVRVAASTAIENLIDKHVVGPVAAPNVAGLMENLLQLTNIVDADSLSSCMTLLVLTYTEQVLPFAVQLVRQLVGSFIRIMEENKEQIQSVDDLDNTDKIGTAMGILNTIESLIISIETKDVNTPEVSALLLELESQLLPCVHYIIDNQIIDLYEECFSLIESITYERKAISEGVWNVFPKICDLMDIDMLDYISEVYELLYNYIAFGKDVVAANPLVQQSLFKLINQVIESELETTDKVAAFKIMQALLLCCKDSINELAPVMLTTALSHRDVSKSFVYRAYFLTTILAGIVYNPVMTMKFLKDHGVFESIMNDMFELVPQLTRLQEVRLAIVALLTILQNVQQLGFNDAMAKPFMSALTIMMKQLPKSEKAFKECQERDSSEDGDDADLSHEGDDHFDGVEEVEYDEENNDWSLQAEHDEDDDEGDDDLDQYLKWGSGNEDYLLDEEADAEHALDNVRVRELYQVVMTSNPAFASQVAVDDLKVISQIVSSPSVTDQSC